MVFKIYTVYTVYTVYKPQPGNRHELDHTACNGPQESHPKGCKNLSGQCTPQDRQDKADAYPVAGRVTGRLASQITDRLSNAVQTIGDKTR